MSKKQKRLFSDKDIRTAREKACELAVDLMLDQEPDMAQLWLYSVFFESYILRGPTWTRKNCDIFPKEETAKVLKFVPKPKTD